MPAEARRSNVFGLLNAQDVSPFNSLPHSGSHESTYSWSSSRARPSSPPRNGSHAPDPSSNAQILLSLPNGGIEPHPSSSKVILPPFRNIAVRSEAGSSLHSSRACTPSLSGSASSCPSPVSFARVRTPLANSFLLPSPAVAVFPGNPSGSSSPASDAGFATPPAPIYSSESRPRKSKFKIVAEIDEDVEPESTDLDGMWQTYASGKKDNVRCTYPDPEKGGDECGFTARKHSTKRHIETKHLSIKRWKCQVCGMHYTQKASLERHHAKHTNSFPYPCKYLEKSGCLRAFNDRSRRHKHMVDCHGHVPKPHTRGNPTE